MKSLSDITSKVRDGQRLSEADALALFCSDDLLELGHLAELANDRLNHRRVWFNENRYLRTRLYSKWGIDERLIATETRTLPPSELVREVLERARRLLSPTTTEVRFGSIDPHKLPFCMLVTIVEGIRRDFPHIQIRALCARNVAYYQQLESLTLDEILTGLKDAGAGYLDPRGAGLFGFDLAQKTQSPVMPADAWLGIHAAAHAHGLVSDAAMAYGYDEPYELRVAHMQRLRELQDQTGGFISFIPLARQYQDTSNGFHRRTVGIDDLKTIAVARLYLDNFANIRATWGRLGLDMAQLALSFGANDLEGTLSNDNNSRVIGARPFRSMNRNEIESLIRKTLHVPRERDSRFHPVGKAPRLSTTVERDDGQVGLILYKAEKGEPISVADAYTLATKASLLQLGHCAAVVKQELSPHAKRTGLLGHALEIAPSDVALHPETSATQVVAVDVALRTEEPQRSTTIVIDLARPEKSPTPVSLDALRCFIASLRQAADGHFAFVVQGLKALFAMARREKLTFAELMRELKESHVTTIESSSFESEDDLTMTEVTGAHRAVHVADMASVAKVELAAPYNGTDTPFWEVFLKRLDALRHLQDTTYGLLALQIETAKGSGISPTEYLRAVALTRMFVRNVPNLVTPFGKLPSLVKGKSREPLSRSRDLLKIAPTVIYFGANDLGFVRMSSANTRLVLAELERSGLAPFLRDATFRS